MKISLNKYHRKGKKNIMNFMKKSILKIIVMIMTMTMIIIIQIKR